jgi:hypothetical protein
MGRTEDFEASLQVLRGFGTDISTEVNDIKVLNVLRVKKFMSSTNLCSQA